MTAFRARAMIRLGCDKKTKTRLRVRPTKGTKKVQLKQNISQQSKQWSFKTRHDLFSLSWNIFWRSFIEKEWISDSKKLRNYILKIQIEQDLFRFAGVPALHTCPLDNWHLSSESLFHTLTPNPHIVAWNRECHTQTCNRKWKSFTAPFVRKWKSNLCFILKSEKVIFSAT